MRSSSSRTLESSQRGITSSSNFNTTSASGVQSVTASAQSSGIGRNLRNQISRLFHSSHSLSSVTKQNKSSSHGTGKRHSRRLIPPKHVQVYAAKKVEAPPPVEEPVVEEENKDDQESLGSFMKGPTYRHLDPRYAGKQKIFWSTTEIAKRLPRCQESIEMSLAELIITSCMITVLLTVAFDMKPTTRFHYQNFLQNNIIHLENREYLKPGEVQFFKEIRGSLNVFSFLDRVFVKGPWLDWYYERNQQKQTLMYMKPLFYILGVPRLRQVRMPTNTCIISDSVSELVKDCYGEFNYPQSEKTFISSVLPQFLDTNLPSFYDKKEWLWTKPRDYSSITSDYYAYVQTEASAYPDGGYIQELLKGKGMEMNNTNRMKALYALGWVRRPTRAIIGEILVYNPNVNLMCSIKIIFEYLPAGGVWPTVQLKTVKIFHLNNKHDYLIFGFITALAAFLLMHCIEEIRELIFFKFEYFVRFWSWVDMMIIITQAYGFYNLGVVLSSVKEAMIRFLKNQNRHFEMDDVIYRDNIHDNCIILVMFLAIYKLFRYVDYYGKVDIFTRTLANGGWALLLFTCRFSLIFFSYAQMGFFLFGSYNEQYSTRLRAILTLLRMYYGYFDYKALKRLQPIIGGFYFMGCIVLLYAMCIGFFLVVLYNYFSIFESVVVITKGASAWGMVIVWCKKAKFWLVDYKRNPPLPSDNITYRELMETLEIMEFTQPEVDLLIRKFTLIPKHTNTPEEVSRMILELQDQIKKQIRKLEAPLDEHLVDMDREAKVKPLTLKQFKMLKYKLDTLEVVVETMTERTVSALRIAEVGRARNKPIRPPKEESGSGEEDDGKKKKKKGKKGDKKGSEEDD